MGNEVLPSFPRTFRIDVDVMKGLEEEAKKQGATVNGLTCRILRRYVKIGAKLEPIGVIGFPKNDLIEIISVIDNDDVIRIATKMGAITVKEIIMQVYGELSTSTFRQFMSMFFCGYGNWASCHEEIKGDNCEIRIGHQLGEKWTLFIKNYIEAALISITGRKPDFKYISDYSLIFQLKS